MGKIRKLMRNNRGQGMLELALILPVVLFLLTGTMEFGRVMHEFLVVTAAAREGARSAAVGGNDAAVIATAREAAASIDRGQLTIRVLPSSRSRGDTVTVTVGSAVEIITPAIGLLFPQNPFPVEGTAVMRVE